MRTRRSRPPSPRDNAVLVAGVGFVPPVGRGLLRGTLDVGEFALITLVVLVAAVLTYVVSRVAYRDR